MMVEVREAVVEDLAAVMAIYRAAGLEGEESFSLDEAKSEMAKVFGNPHYKLFAALLEGEVVGTYSLLIMDKLTKRGRRAGIVDDVGVMPEMQGKGIGRAMMAHAMERCREAGCYKLALSSNLRRTKAHAFYASLGFEQHGLSFVVSL